MLFYLLTKKCICLQDLLYTRCRLFLALCVLPRERRALVFGRVHFRAALFFISKEKGAEEVCLRFHRLFCPVDLDGFCRGESSRSYEFFHGKERRDNAVCFIFTFFFSPELFFNTARQRVTDVYALSSVSLRIFAKKIIESKITMLQYHSRQKISKAILEHPQQRYEAVMEKKKMKKKPIRQMAITHTLARLGIG